jgi:hypothetical protein
LNKKDLFTDLSTDLKHYSPALTPLPPNTKVSTQDNSGVGVLKDMVSSCFNNIVIPDLIPKMNNLLTNYQAAKQGIYKMKREYLSSAESLYKNYGNFVEYNNNGK